MELINGFTKNELHKLMWNKPSFAQIELTRNCNQSCIFCFADCSIRQHYKNYPFDIWKNVLDKLKELGVTTIHFTGGENFLHEDFKKIVKYTKEKNFQVQMNTNGTYDVDDFLDCVDVFTFSVHGLNDKHDDIVKLKGSFVLVEQNIKKCSDANKEICINTVMIKQNFNEILSIYKYFNDKYKISKFGPTFAAISNNGTEFQEFKIDINKNNLEKYFKILSEIDKDKLILKHGLYSLFDYDCNLINRNFPIELPICAAGKDKLIIKYDGSVYPCNFFLNEEHYCGNIFNEDIFEIWKNGNGFNKFRNVFLNEKMCDKCKECLNKRCFGGCRVWTKKYMEGNKEISDERDIRCEIMDAFVGDRNN